MDQLIANILNLLQNSGGTLPYQVVLDSISFQERAMFPNALKIAKRSNQFSRVLRWDAELRTIVLTVEIIQES